jgi:hypothetical protein
MARAEDFDDEPGRALTRAVVAMVAVALLVGASLGLALMAGAKIVGLGGDDATASPDSGGPASLYMPPYQPTEDAGDGWNLPRPVESPSALTTGSTDDATQEPEEGEITLFAAPQQVSPGQRINFNGVYEGAEGAVLQVQRQDGGSWSDFPVTASVRGGSFETWIMTSRAGETKFRVVDGATDVISNVVTVQIG